MEFMIKQELLEATLNYLATKPWAEVQGLMGGLSKLPVAPKIEEKPAEPAKETK